MKRRIAIPVLLLAAVGMWAAFSATALALPSYSTCTACHPTTTAVTVKATQTANDGTNATYSVAVTGGTGWAVFNGTSNLVNKIATSGSFSVPVGSTYTVWGASKSPMGSASVSISPVKPTPPPADTVAPVTTSNAKATYVLQRGDRA